MNEQTSLLTKYFDSNILFLKLTGFWLYENQTISKQKILQYTYNIFWFLYLFVIYVPTEILYVFYSYNDLNMFLRALRDIGNHVSLVYKAFNYFIMRKEILNLIEILQNGDFHYEEENDFQPENIITQEKQQALKWTKYFLNFCNAICLSMFLTGLITFLFMSESQYQTENNQRVYKQLQPVNTVSPFGSGTRPKFFMSFIYTIIALPFLAWMIVDSLFITLMSCVSAHLRILKGAFQTLRSRCIKRVGLVFDSQEILHDPEILELEVDQEMIKCIKHLQVVLKISEKIETIYSTQTFIQTFISLGEMCFSLYLLSETLDQSVGNEITYLIATGFELLLYCWFGNRITEGSIQLKNALYESDWFSTSLSFRKKIIFTMTRMQKPIYVTIGKITPLTFNTFLTIARGAYSFFTFLKQRHGIRNK